jgi:hypothetical protein
MRIYICVEQRRCMRIDAYVYVYIIYIYIYI